MWRWRKTKKERSLGTLQKELSVLVEEIYAMDPLATKTIRTVVFNAKYKKDMIEGETNTPSQLLTQFIDASDKGDRKFLRHYFYRVLRKNHDPVIRRLKYRLKRTY